VKKVKVTSKGQITLPQSMRQKLGIREGDYLDVLMQGNALLLKPSPRDNSTQLLMEHSSKYCTDNASLEKARKVLSKVPFSLSQKVSDLREERNED
jgi:AbrB family looped-hinge helix DNA binding protein